MKGEEEMKRKEVEMKGQARILDFLGTLLWSDFRLPARCRF